MNLQGQGEPVVWMEAGIAATCLSWSRLQRQLAAETTVVSYASDLPFLGAWGPGYQLGPGTIRVAHTEGERIAKAELLQGTELYVKLAKDLIGRS